MPMDLRVPPIVMEALRGCSRFVTFVPHSVGACPGKLWALKEKEGRTREDLRWRGST